MKVTYQPEGKEPQTWEVKPGRLRESQAELIEKRFGAELDQWHVSVIKGGARARRVLLWHLLAREHHTLRFEDTPDYYREELKVEYDYQELLEMRANVEKSSAVSGEEKETMLAQIDDEINGYDGPDKPDLVANPEQGKARSKTRARHA